VKKNLKINPSATVEPSFDSKIASSRAKRALVFNAYKNENSLKTSFHLLILEFTNNND
jgi:hypothetical protein